MYSPANPLQAGLGGAAPLAVRVEAEHLVVVGGCLLAAPELAQRIAAAQIGVGGGIEPDQRVIVSGREIVILVEEKRPGAVAQRAPVRGIAFHHLVVVGDGADIILLFQIRVAAKPQGIDIAGIEPDHLGEVGDRALAIARQIVDDGTRLIERRELLAAELARRDGPVAGGAPLVFRLVVVALRRIEIGARCGRRVQAAIPACAVGSDQLPGLRPSALV